MKNKILFGVFALLTITALLAEAIREDNVYRSKYGYYPVSKDLIVINESLRLLGDIK